jgi:hypothetical protein
MKNLKNQPNPKSKGNYKRNLKSQRRRRNTRTRNSTKKIKTLLTRSPAAPTTCLPETPTSKT